MTGGKTDATALASVGRTGEMLAVEVIMNDVGDRTDREENHPFSGKAIRWESADILDDHKSAYSKDLASLPIPTNNLFIIPCSQSPKSSE